MIDIPKKLQKKVEALLDFARAYPDTQVDTPWGFFAVKVKGKGFLGIKWDEAGICISFKLPRSGEEALLLPFTEPTHGGLGKSGWVSALFAPGDAVPLDLLEHWIDESYRATKPKGAASALKSGAAVKRAKKAVKAKPRSR